MRGVFIWGLGGGAELRQPCYEPIKLAAADFRMAAQLEAAQFSIEHQTVDGLFADAEARSGRLDAE